MRVAVFGDVHGCWEELLELIEKIKTENVDEIWSLGDLVDRGPDSGRVIDICIANSIKLIQGNHEENILRHLKGKIRDPNYRPYNPVKAKTLSELKPEHYPYLRNAPKLHVIDDLKIILVHAGLWPDLPLYLQPDNVVRVQLINPNEPGKTRWMGYKAPEHPCGKTEQESEAEGWRRWYNVWDGDYTVYYGHSVYKNPKIVGNTVGIDQGGVFGHMFTAAIIDETDTKFLQVRAKRQYAPFDGKYED